MFINSETMWREYCGIMLKVKISSMTKYNIGQYLTRLYRLIFMLVSVRFKAQLNRSISLPLAICQQYSSPSQLFRVITLDVYDWEHRAPAWHIAGLEHSSSSCCNFPKLHPETGSRICCVSMPGSLNCKAIKHPVNSIPWGWVNKKLCVCPLTSS